MVIATKPHGQGQQDLLAASHTQSGNDTATRFFLALFSKAMHGDRLSLNQ